MDSSMLPCMVEINSADGFGVMHAHDRSSMSGTSSKQLQVSIGKVAINTDSIVSIEPALIFKANEIRDYQSKIENYQTAYNQSQNWSYTTSSYRNSACSRLASMLGGGSPTVSPVDDQAMMKMATEGSIIISGNGGSEKVVYILKEPISDVMSLMIKCGISTNADQAELDSDSLQRKV
jgi:hypothetical protein